MNKSKFIKLIFIIVVATVVYFVSHKEDTLQEIAVVKGDLEIQEALQDTTHILSSFDWYPTSTTGQIVKHNYYTLSYHEKHEQAEWVAYELSSKNLSRQKIERPGFKRDSLVTTKSAHTYDYRNSGYDRGHLCPAADRKQSEEAYDETFLMSNVTPQEHEFNSGIWKRLESKVRYWALHYDSVYVITGGILQSGLPTIGSNKVSVPNYFYKIIFRGTPDNPQLIAFLMPHADSDEALYTYVVPVDEIEKETGIDFFPALPDTIEDRLEAKKDIKGWLFD